MAHAEGGRTDDARTLLEIRHSGLGLPEDELWLTAMVDYAEAAIECRDPKYAGPLFDRLAPWSNQFALPAVLRLWAGQPLPRRPGHRPRSLQRGGLILLPICGDERPDGCEILCRPDRPPVGTNVRHTRCSRQP